MARALTPLELFVLAHVVVDPADWWRHANAPDAPVAAEAALRAKVLRHAPTAQAAFQASLEGGPAYQTRAEREAARPAANAGLAAPGPEGVD